MGVKKNRFHLHTTFFLQKMFFGENIEIFEIKNHNLKDIFRL